MNKYNHLYNIKFTVITNSPSGEVSAKEIREGLQIRLLVIDDAELLDSVNYLGHN